MEVVQMKRSTAERVGKAVLITLVAWLALVLGVNYGAGVASATESHVSATAAIPCGAQAGTITVSVHATDGGNTAIVTGAYVLAGAVFDSGYSATLSGLFLGTVLTTGPVLGDAGPAVTHSFPAAPGTYTVALTLTFANGFVSTGTATVTVPTADACPQPTTTTTTTAPATTTTAPPVSSSNRSVSVTCAAPGVLRVTNDYPETAVLDWWNGLPSPIAHTALPAAGSVDVAYPNPVGVGYATGYQVAWSDGVTYPPSVTDSGGGVAQSVANISDAVWLCRPEMTGSTQPVLITGSTLPATGGDTATWLLVGGVALLLGVGLVLAGRVTDD
jgi:LPXTG-motif cell wall-anchored protein